MTEAASQHRPLLTWPVEQPTIAGADIALRPWHPADARQVVAACQDPLIGRFTRIPQPYGPDDADRFIAESGSWWAERTAAPFAGVDVGDDEALLVSVGLLGINPLDLTGEIGYWTVPAHRRHGYAAAAVALLSKIALTQWGFVRIELHADVANVPSQRVAMAAGFRSEGIARCSLFLAGRHRDGVVFSRVRRDL